MINDKINHSITRCPHFICSEFFLLFYQKYRSSKIENNKLNMTFRQRTNNKLIIRLDYPVN